MQSRRVVCYRQHQLLALDPGYLNVKNGSVVACIKDALHGRDYIKTFLGALEAGLIYLAVLSSQ